MAGKMFRTYAVGAAVVLLTAWIHADVQAAVAYRTVALAGEVALGAGATFSSFSFRPPAINGAGQVAFHGSLIGPGMTFTDPSIWVGSPGSLTLAARRGEFAPGTGISFAGFFDASPVLNSAGQVAFGGFLNGQGVNFTNNTGIWAGTPGSLVLVARKGDAAPGAGAGATFRSDTGRPLLNGAGQVAFRSFLAGPGVGLSNNQGIWVGEPGSLALAVRLGDTAAGTGVGVNFKSFNAFRLNDAGQIALASDLIGVGVDSTNNEGIWVGLPGSLTLAAREGNAAPGAGAGVHFGSFLFNAPSLNGSGQLAFLGSLIGPGVDSSNGSGIWTGTPGSLSMVVRDGEPAPGAGVGVNFGSFDRPVLNGAGQVAFEGYLQRPGGEPYKQPRHLGWNTGFAGTGGTPGRSRPGHRYRGQIRHFTLRATRA